MSFVGPGLCFPEGVLMGLGLVTARVADFRGWRGPFWK